MPNPQDWFSILSKNLGYSCLWKSYQVMSSLIKQNSKGRDPREKVLTKGVLFKKRIRPIVNMLLINMHKLMGFLVPVLGKQKQVDIPWAQWMASLASLVSTRPVRDFFSRGEKDGCYLTFSSGLHMYLNTHTNWNGCLTHMSQSPVSYTFYMAYDTTRSLKSQVHSWWNTKLPGCHVHEM